MHYKNQDILSANQFDLSGLKELFTVAEAMKPIHAREKKCDALDGCILGNFFLEPSTRTRMSFATAFMRLGGKINDFGSASISSVVKGESFEDTIRMVESYADILVVRHSEVGSANQAARCANIPVINAGDGAGEHTTQALLDVYTMYEFKKEIDGLTVAMIGDLKFGRTVHSLVKLLSLYENITILFVAPEAFQIPEEILDFLKSKSVTAVKTADLKEALKNADVLYMTRLQKERLDEDQVTLNKYILTKEIIEKFSKRTALIMHPLPRNEEIASDVDTLSNAVYFKQAANGVLIRMALFALIFGVEVV